MTLLKTLVIGAGEVGTSLSNVLKRKYDVSIRDKEEPKEEITDIEVLNICFPYFDGFIEAVKKYVEIYKPKFTIIHSTVPPGTTRQLGDKFVHSPIHGKHPNLEKGILTFVKYVGGIDPDIAINASDFLKNADINTNIVDSPETSELSKICCTTQYGWMIVMMREIKDLCEKHGADFYSVYGWNQFYNEGYKELGFPWFCRPVLEYMPGKIGGHCVAQNAKLVDSFLTNLVSNKQKEYENSEVNQEVD
jgi:UDP-N-acetyl-D-mannosaminuronate dehydrogenase